MFMSMDIRVSPCACWLMSVHASSVSVPFRSTGTTRYPCVLHSLLVPARLLVLKASQISSMHWRASALLAQGEQYPTPSASSLAFCSLGIQSHIPSAGGLLSKKLRLPNLGNDPRQMPFCLLSSPLCLLVPDYTQIIVLQATCKFLASAQHIFSNISGFH